MGGWENIIFGYFSALKNITCSNASESGGAEKSGEGALNARLMFWM